MNNKKLEYRIKNIYPHSQIVPDGGYKYQIIGENKYFYYYGEQSKDELINIHSNKDNEYVLSIFIDKF